MKKIKVLTYLILAFVCMASFGLLLFNPNKTFADNDAFIEVTALNQITDSKGKYRLAKSETPYTYTESCLENFYGVFDGNGCVVKFNAPAVDYFVGTPPLFGNIGAGAEVYNIKFSSEDNFGLNYYFGTTKQQDVKTSYGLLANTISNATVYGIDFNNLYVNIYDNPAFTTTSELNVGLLAGQIFSSKISQIRITDCKLLSQSKVNFDETIEYNYIRSNANIGMVAGKALNGTYLQNNIISSTRNASKCLEMDLHFEKSEASLYNVGGLVGVFESGYITNNILDFTHQSKVLINVYFTDDEMPLNFGYFAGKTTSNIVSIYSNILNLNSDNMLEMKDNNKNVIAGLIVGKMETKLANKDIEGFITTYSGQYIGNINNETTLLNYANIYKIDTENVIASRINNKEIWNDIYQWNTSNIWHVTYSAVLPTLQFFEVYNVTFSSLDSVKSLRIENQPTLTGENVVLSSLSLTPDSDIYNDSINVQFGTNLYISTSVTATKNYSKFFYITGLLLNGVKIYDLETNKSLEGYSIFSDNVVGDHNVIFEIKNFTANNLGVYSVQLARKTYKLNINVLELDVNGEKLLPGKVKNNMASDGSSNLEIDMQYGVKYTYETFNVNSDYAREADWYLSYVDTTLEEQPVFDYINAKTSFVGKRNLEWIFNESCALFGSGIEGDENTYIDINSYDETTKRFNIYVVFTKDVKDIEIRFKFADETEIKEQIAEVVIDNGAVSLEYNKDGYYTAKIRYSNKLHTITLRNLSTDYKFEGWYINTRLAGVTGDEYAGSFEIINDGNANTVVISAVFEKADTNDGANLLWLWITLAIVGVGLVVLVVVIVVRKKKNSGGSSYRKHMY